MAGAGANLAGTGEQLLMRLLQTQQEQMGQLQRLLEQNQRPRGTVVDTKAIGRPEKLGGTLVDGVTPEKVQEFNRQLEVVLGTLTMDTPGDITMNSSPGSGLDMYRRLHGRLDPSDMVTSFRWLRQLMSTKPVAEVSDLIAAVERWEDQHRRYAARRDCTALTERQKMVSLLGLVPAELQSHLELNLPRLTTYDLLRREIVTFAENRRAFTVDDSGAIPMEIDYAKGKGQGKGKGKDKETRKCHKCGKTGHLIKDCWNTIDIRKNKDAGGGSSGSGGNPKTPTPGGRGKGGAPPKGKAQGRGRGRKGHARQLTTAEEEGEGDAEEPEQEDEEYEAEVGFLGMLHGDDDPEDRKEGGEPRKPGGEEKKEGEERKEKEEDTEDESWGTWSGAGSSRDPPPPEASGRERASAKAKASGGTSSVTGVGLRLLQGSLSGELFKRQAELRASREKAKDDAEREAIDRQLDEVKEQLKALLQKKKEGAAVPKAGQKSARHQADLDAGHKPKLAKRKELSRQRAAQHRQDSREGRSKERKVLDEEWHKRYDRPLGKKDDGKEASYPLMPSSTERQARPLSRKARENLRQEEGTDLPSAPTGRTWREKPKTEGERQGKRRREAKRQLRRKGSQGKGTRAKAKGEEKQAEPEGKGPEPKAKGTDKPTEPKGVPPPRKGPRYSKKVRWRLPRRWRRPSARLPNATRRKKEKREKKELARTRVGTRQVQGPEWARARSLGRLWLGCCERRPRGCLRTRSSRRTGWVLWWLLTRQRTGSPSCRG